MTSSSDNYLSGRRLGGRQSQEFIGEGIRRVPVGAQDRVKGAWICDVQLDVLLQAERQVGLSVFNGVST